MLQAILFGFDPDIEPRSKSSKLQYYVTRSMVLG